MTEDTFADDLFNVRRRPLASAHVDAQQAAWPLDLGFIARHGDPDTCDAALLPFLFFDRGGTLWSDDWPEAKRRQVVRDLPVYKRLEGSPAGVEAYLNLAGGYLTREELPPGSSFWFPEGGLDYEAVLALMPQLRLYHDHPARYEPASGFWGAGFYGLHFWTPETASPLGRYAVLWDRGVETPLAASDLALDGRTARLTRPGDSGAASFWGSETAHWGVSFYGDAYGHEPLVFDLADPGLSRQRVPGFARWEEGFWSGTHWGAAHWIPPGDLGGVYDRLHLWDPARIPRHTSAYTGGGFWSVSRYGVPAYHQFLEIALPVHGVQPGAWMHWSAGFWMPHDHGPLAFAMRAIEAARRPGDRLLIELSPTAAGVLAPPLPVLDPEPA